MRLEEARQILRENNLPTCSCHYGGNEGLINKAIELSNTTNQTSLDAV